ncbi:hypothetical protein D16iCDA_20720 [Pseudomonas seleniipraecipitans]|uniref:Uncharacterized protein n=1 Tax=Phytopseudomonas seleniipraecipitans TaxID=640205 RepID=A0ABY5J7L9_9GAMM|nr:hypothetical protein [Pseudomonas seleniipraecipitans]UUD64066.1 hypothetical protein D16iCDA_20720 [Pseudomonas seleniipraecipitans]
MNEFAQSDVSVIHLAVLHELLFELPSLSVFFFINLSCTLAIASICVFRFLRCNYILSRLSFCFLAFICIFYQMPLALFSTQVEASLQQPWTYALVVNGGAMLLALWGFLSRRFDCKQKVSHCPDQKFGIYFATMLFGAICLLAYLWGVPWNCTGLFALIFDPWLTLLAREFGIKLIGSSLSTYMFGAYANAVAPILILLSVWLVRDALLHRRVLSGLLGVFGGGLAIVAVLVSGTKGLLMPSMLMLVAGCYFWCATWISRIATIFLAIIFVMSALVSFEMFKERGGVVGGAYDFAACSVEVDTCQESRELLQSMTARDYSLGLPGVFVKPLQDRLYCLCSGGTKESCPTGILGDSPNMSRLSATDKAGRSLTFVNALLNRMLVVPFQVSVWHFMYAETERVEGLKTLPFSRRLLGESVNMPELVYQKYGSVYSLGDRTSTSTAPTSFFLAYPAYLGLAGFLLALVLVITLDIFLVIYARFIGESLLPILIGGIIIMCMNFMTSDFVTVLISHGGVAGLIVLLIHALLRKRYS